MTIIVPAGTPTSVLALALCMPFEAAAEILTLTDEPALILAPGEAPPVYPSCHVAAARLRSQWEAPNRAERQALNRMCERAGLEAPYTGAAA